MWGKKGKTESGPTTVELPELVGCGRFGLRRKKFTQRGKTPDHETVARGGEVPGARLTGGSIANSSVSQKKRKSGDGHIKTPNQGALPSINERNQRILPPGARPRGRPKKAGADPVAVLTGKAEKSASPGLAWERVEQRSYTICFARLIPGKERKGP